MAFAELISWASSVVANDSSCSAALNLGNSTIGYNIPWNPSSSLQKYTNPPSITPNPTGTFPTSAQKLRLYGLNGTIYAANYSSGSFTKFQNITTLDIALEIQNSSSPIAVAGTTNQFIYQAKLYLSAFKDSSALGANNLLVDESVPINLVVDTTLGKITGCSGFRLGNGTAVNVPICASGQVVFANGAQFSCVNVGCPARWSSVSTPSEAGYIPPNNDLTGITNGLVNSTTAGYNTTNGWRSSLGCTMCNIGASQIVTSGYTYSNGNTAGSVKCVNPNCPNGWHVAQSKDEPGAQAAGVDLSQFDQNLKTAFGYNYFSGWSSSQNCAPGSYMQPCTNPGLPDCPNTTLGAATCNIPNPVPTGNYCYFNCGDGTSLGGSPATNNSDCYLPNRIHKKSQCTNGYFSSVTYYISAGVSNCYNDFYPYHIPLATVCWFNNSGCPPGWNKYQNCSTTTSSRCDGDCWSWCTTGSHILLNRAIEGGCTYGCAGFTHQCSGSNPTQMGCY